MLYRPKRWCSENASPLGLKCGKGLCLSAPQKCAAQGADFYQEVSDSFVQ